LSKVQAIKVSLEQVINSDSPNAAIKDFVTPIKATVLSYNAGTLIQAQEGGLYLVSMGTWFRTPYNGKAMTQVDAFDQLQDLGLTVIKDKIVRHEEKTEKKEVSDNGQAIRSQNNVSPKKANKAVATDIKSEAKD
jgi:hypothetical protein